MAIQYFNVGYIILAEPEIYSTSSYREFKTDDVFSPSKHSLETELEAACKGKNKRLGTGATFSQKWLPVHWDFVGTGSYI